MEQRNLLSFFPAVYHDAGPQPGFVLTDDFNRDGKPDLVALNSVIPGTVRVLLGDGDGSFQPPAAFAAGDLPRHAAAGDFNRDGKPDLAVIYSGLNSVDVFLGNGDGSFQPAIATKTGLALDEVAAADFNRDGVPDLVVTDVFKSAVRVLLGNGDGSFRQGVSSAAGFQPRSVAAADFNRDGVPDLVVTNFNLLDNGVSVLLGNGDGSFRDPVTYSFGTRLVHVAVGDFNRDAVPDLAVTNDQFDGDDLYVLLGDGGGSFWEAGRYDAGPRPGRAAVADFDRDGKPDLAVAKFVGHTLSVLLGDGAGSFQDALGYDAGREGFAVAAGDFNRDGAPDLAVANRLNIAVLLNAVDWEGGTPSPDLMPPRPRAAAVALFAGGRSFEGRADYAGGTSIPSRPFPDLGTEAWTGRVKDDRGAPAPAGPVRPPQLSTEWDRADALFQLFRWQEAVELP